MATASAGTGFRLNSVSKRLRLNSVSIGGNDDDGDDDDDAKDTGNDDDDNSKKCVSKDAQNKQIPLFKFVKQLVVFG